MKPLRDSRGTTEALGRIRELQTRADVFERVTHDRLTALEGEFLTFKTVLGATVDDTLRACIVLEELANAGVLRPLPWRLATVVVELHHARYAKDHNEVPEGSDAGALDARLSRLQALVTALRAEFVASLLAPPTP